LPAEREPPRPHWPAGLSKLNSVNAELDVVSRQALDGRSHLAIAA